MRTAQFFACRGPGVARLAIATQECVVGNHRRRCFMRAVPVAQVLRTTLEARRNEEGFRVLVDVALVAAREGSLAFGIGRVRVRWSEPDPRYRCAAGLVTYEAIAERRVRNHRRRAVVSASMCAHRSDSLHRSRNAGNGDLITACASVASQQQGADQPSEDRAEA